MMAAVAALIALVLLYVVLAAVLPTSWTMDAAGLTVRSAAILGARVHVPWADVASIGCGSTVVYRTTVESMNLDARITRQRHVTIVRRGGKRAIQFTPRAMADFERQLQVVLGSQSGWCLDERGWHPRGLLP